MVLLRAWYGLAELGRPLWHRIPDSKYANYESAYLPGVSEFEAWFHARYDAYYAVVTSGGLGTGTLIIALAYLAAIRLGQRLMRDHRPFRLQAALFLWNVLLATFSILATVRCLPELVDILATRGWTAASCNGRFVVGRLGTWTVLFGLSKLVELGDTAFLVLRKKPVIFLHYIHHILTMCVCGYFGFDMQANARWFTTTNVFIHSIMYTYFALRAIHVHVPKSVSMVITTLQITQMVVGVAVSVESLYRVTVTPAECDNSRGIVLVCLAMYALYFVLFAQFFAESYMAASARPRERARKASGDATKPQPAGLTPDIPVGGTSRVTQRKVLRGNHENGTGGVGDNQ